MRRTIVTTQERTDRVEEIYFIDDTGKHLVEKFSLKRFSLVNYLSTNSVKLVFGMVLCPGLSLFCA